MIEDGWERLISHACGELVVCPYCKEETFIQENKISCECMNGNLHGRNFGLVVPLSMSMYFSVNCPLWYSKPFLKLT